jgi:hypothetical protein
MTDGGAGLQPGDGEASVPVRPRSAFVGHEVFGHGPGAVLVEPKVARDLRTAAELASQERRIAGGLLYGGRWADDEGRYLVVDGFLDAGPREDRDDKIAPDGRDFFALSDADLRLLRTDAARMYSAATEVGWWRSLPGPGEFNLGDFDSQRELVGPGGVGLLVFGSGLEWGTAYLGPDGEVPGSVRSFIPVPRPATEPPRLRPPGLGPAPVPAVAPESAPAPEPEAGAGLADDAGLEGSTMLEPATDPEPEPVAAAASGTSLATRTPVLTPAPQPTGPRVISPVRVPAREWGGAKLTNPGYVGPQTPTDVKIVVGALIITALLAAIMVGILVSNVIVAVIAGVVLLLGLGGFLWMSRL